jgi:hypothetical protein
VSKAVAAPGLRRPSQLIVKFGKAATMVIVTGVKAATMAIDGIAIAIIGTMETTTTMLKALLTT